MFEVSRMNHEKMVATSSLITIDLPKLQNISLVFDKVYDSPLIYEEKKLLFCWIAKNSCTKFKLLMALLNTPNLFELEPKLKKDSMEIHNLAQHYTSQILQATKQDGFEILFRDNNWKRVIFVISDHMHF